MKSLYVLSVLFLASSAFANQPSFELRSTDAYVVPIAGEVTSVRPLCPDGMTCFANGTIVSFRFMLGSCVSRMIPLSYDAIETDGVLNVYVSAMEIASRNAIRVMCAAPGIVNQEITLFNRYGDVKVHFLGASATD